MDVKWTYLGGTLYACQRCGEHVERADLAAHIAKGCGKLASAEVREAIDRVKDQIAAVEGRVTAIEIKQL